MKSNRSLACFIASGFLFLAGFAAAAESSWKLEGTRIWSREPGTATMNVEDGVYQIKSTAQRDWAVGLHSRIPVKPGEVYKISYDVQSEGPGDVSFCGAIFGDDKKIIDWNLGRAAQSGPCDKKTISDEFVIPRNGTLLEPRLVGTKPIECRCSNFSLKKTGDVELIEPKRTVTESGVDLISGNEISTLVSNLKISPSQNGPAVTHEHYQKYGTSPNVKIAALEGNAWEVSPKEPFQAKSGDLVFVTARVNVESGSPELLVYPWKGGMRGSTSFASGTFRPTKEEEGGKWCCIHAYVTVPENIDGFVPALRSTTGGTVLLANLTVSRPSAEELNPARKKVDGYAKSRLDEKLDRGLIAIRTESGVHLGWRLLKTDPKETTFDVYRIAADGKETKLNESPVTKTTDFTDKDVPKDADCRWMVRVSGGTKNSVAESDEVVAQETPYVSIKLKGEKSFDRIAFADLDGDGKLDYVIKTPNSNIDPYINYWKKSPSPYKLQAYKSDGTFLWEYDLGWGIEQGIWYSPYLVADLDGDGCAEIAVKTCPGDFRDENGRVYSGPEHLMILDGKTGKERLHIDWPERDGLSYNLSSRHQLCLAYLDGKTPSLIVLRGTYSRQVAVAYQLKPGANKLEELWRYDNRWMRHLGRWGQGAHTTHAFDLDGDGRDEVILGSIVLDDDGSVLWELKLGHPDHLYVGDIDPERPGLEIVYGIETRQKERNGVCMVDAQTGKILWGHDKPTIHVHSTGMVSDIDARYPGCEIWSGERDSETDRWLRDAKGNFLDLPKDFPVKSLAPRSVWWDADLQRELIHGPRPVDFPSFKSVDKTKFEGSIRLIGDVLGDWREEVVTSCDGEIRIYSTTIPAEDRRTTFLQDANYRATLRECSMGYWQIPLPSYDLNKARTP